MYAPLITSSDALQGVDSLEETLKKMQKFYERYPEVRIACINGHMKEAEIKDILHAFANGEYHILLSTTIVEVGVNVPNASVMVIKNAERFGLAQLHSASWPCWTRTIPVLLCSVEPGKE